MSTLLLLRDPALLQVWSRSIAFAKQACAGRTSGHNHDHAQKVVETSLLIASGVNSSSASTTTTTSDEAAASRAKLLRRVVQVAALHDVNDHKYDFDGKLSEKVAAFVRESNADDAEEAKQILQAVSAVSFSKEKKNGKRWFERELSQDFVIVRDCVSDADKIYAIGVEGLTRCWCYGLELVLAGKTPENFLDGDQKIDASKAVPWLVARTIEHADEKLLHLKDDYIVTEAGKFLAAPRHEDLLEMITKWRRGESVPTSLDAPLHW